MTRFSADTSFSHPSFPLRQGLAPAHLAFLSSLVSLPPKPAPRPSPSAGGPGKLRILHMTYASDAGGLSRYVHDMAVASRDAGHDVAIAGDTGAWQWLFDQSKLDYIQVPYKAGPSGVLTAVRKIRHWTKRHWGTETRGDRGGGGIDLFHSHYRRPSLAARIMQRLGSHAPLLYTLHLSHLALNWRNRWFSDFGDHTHVASSEALYWLTTEARVSPANVTLIPHGIHLDQWPVTTPDARAAARRALGLGLNDRVAVYAGRLDQRHPKNVPWLLDLAAQWGGGGNSPDRPDLKILIAGEGPDAPELQSRIEREGLADRVRLLGHVAPLGPYQASDLLLLPSGREGFSLVCAEAMCTGVPVLRTQTSGTAELILENRTGQSTPIDRDAFIRAALALLRNEPQLQAMRLPAAEHIRRHFDFKSQYRQTQALYERLISEQLR